MLYGDGIHDDTLALQTMLDGCGVVMVDKPGTYLFIQGLRALDRSRVSYKVGGRI